ncbi:ferrichrome-iron receptor [Nostoc calcicola FACHB-389]|nr:TonB-dependent siderophore receptor [Nostoc calcicola FACHB-3891]OKH42502.1 ferrichrome-iron receptor [Nostoc calcicola FACHB-389]
MKLSRSFFISCFLVAVVVRPGQAKEVTKISPIQEPSRFARTVKEWLAQIEEQHQTPQTEVVQVTGVKVNPTNKGVEVILQTSKGEQLPITNRSAGNNFIADIPNAQLRLPSGEAFTFRSDKPIAGITEITVTNFDANTIRVTVTGETIMPVVELFDSPDEGLVFSVASAATSAPSQQQPQTQPTPQPSQSETQTEPSQPSAEGDKPIELVVTGEQDGYSVPDASTATRTDTPLRDIPQSIQVVPQQVIKDQQITRISDAARNVSGVTPQGGYAGATDNYNIRGFTTYDNLRNGFSVQDNFVNPTNIERIEVLKGPASVLYGQFEPGGVVNYITKQPLSEPYYFAEFTAGNFSTYRPSIDISGPLNSDRTLLYRLNAAYENSGSFIDFGNQEVLAIAPALTYKIGDATTLTLEYEYLKLDRTYYDGLPPDPSVFKAPISRFLGEPGDRFSQETHSVFLNVNHRFSKNIQLRSGFSVTLNDSQESEFRPNSIDLDGRTVLRRFAAGPGYLQNYSLQNDLIANFSTGSIQHQVLVGLEWNKYIYGYDYLRSSVSLTPSIDLFNPVYGASPPPEFDEAAQRDRNDRNTIALYLQDQVTLLPNLKLLVGGRYDFVHRKNRSQLLDSLGREPIDDTSVDRLYDEAFSPRIGIVYQPLAPISIYASYSRSFNPGFSRTVDGTQLPPERGTQYEVGLKAELIKDRLSATFAAYDITKKNVATTDPTPGNSDFSIAAGEVKSRGLEFDVSGQILPGWNLIASYFVNDAFVSQDNSLPVGDLLVNAPGSGGSLWTTYEIQSGGMKGLGFGGGVFYTGDREATLPNTFKIPSYVRADASIFYKHDNWRVGLNFKNLFGTTYYDSQGYYLRPGAPLTVLGTVSIEF